MRSAPLLSRAQHNLAAGDVDIAPEQIECLGEAGAGAEKEDEKRPQMRRRDRDERPRLPGRQKARRRALDRGLVKARPVAPFAQGREIEHGGERRVDGADLRRRRGIGLEQRRDRAVGRVLVDRRETGRAEMLREPVHEGLRRRTAHLEFEIG